MPIFSITPASTTEPAVGASVCASGSHVWNGNSGTFTAKPIANARNSTLGGAAVNVPSPTPSR